jgi:hypothetical protein
MFVVAGPDEVALADRAVGRANPAFCGTDVFVGLEIAL